MNRFRLSAALLLVLAPLAGTAYAADPEFKVALVTESREYEREMASGSIEAACSCHPRSNGRAA